MRNVAISLTTHFAFQPVDWQPDTLQGIKATITEQIENFKDSTTIQQLTQQLGLDNYTVAIETVLQPSDAEFPESIIVIRLVPKSLINKHDEIFECLLSHFDNWRRRALPENSRDYIKHKKFANWFEDSHALTSPFDRGFNGVIGFYPDSNVLHTFEHDFDRSRIDFADCSFLHYYTCRRAQEPEPPNEDRSEVGVRVPNYLTRPAN